MQRAGRNKEAVTLVHRHGVQHLGQGVILDALLKLRLGDFMVKAIVQEGTRLTVQHIPHFGLAVLMLVFQRVLVGGVYLNGQIVLCVNELCQDWELFKLLAVGAKAARVGGHIVRQRCAVRQIAGTVRVAGKHPRLGQRVQIALDAKVTAQAAAAPQVILAAGSQFQYIHMDLLYLKFSFFTQASSVSCSRKK